MCCSIKAFCVGKLEVVRECLESILFLPIDLHGSFPRVISIFQVWVCPIVKWMVEEHRMPCCC